MRITGGRLRGRVLSGRVGEGVRPTASRTREALFSMIGQDLGGLSVLDAFGGTGLLGFEAASRGAAPVLIVERRAAVAREITAGATSLGLRPPELSVRVADAAAVLAAGRWDIVLLDPPYAEDPARWVGIAAPAVGLLLVIEHRHGAALPDTLGGLVVDRRRNYGDSALTIYRPGSASVGEEADVVGDDRGVIEGQGRG